MLINCRKAAPLFDTIDDQLDYMEEADLDVARANLLESEGRISEAADVHMMEGHLNPSVSSHTISQRTFRSSNEGTRTLT
jgi:hypothetical protein